MAETTMPGGATGTSGPERTIAIGRPEVIDNPLSGERITISHRPTDPTTGALGWDLVLAPGGRVPSSHAHPRQEERFSVVTGVMAFRVGRRRMHVGPGQTVTVPPNTVHHFANAGREPAHVAVQTRPALEMEALLVTAARLARVQHAAGHRFPRLADLALFLRDFEPEVRAPYLPAAVLRGAVRPVAALLRRAGLDEHYRRRRAGDARDEVGRGGAPADRGRRPGLG